jgi:hypothetical protein
MEMETVYSIIKVKLYVGSQLGYSIDNGNIVIK